MKVGDVAERGAKAPAVPFSGPQAIQSPARRLGGQAKRRGLDDPAPPLGAEPHVPQVKLVAEDPNLVGQ
ncbi:hypothetical protein MBOU_33450 [Mycobacterium bourgelatii]|uniref:Uncharacterized protein n=1 Tax=Mycobacterium bourgelatii TaxID=1273442 RepID=A0A7I9YRZ9_MYCBU|nr:hypothetical protein MBOU_33450 [Mycobacterium bourgelatii]